MGMDAGRFLASVCAYDSLGSRWPCGNAQLALSPLADQESVILMPVASC